jgi:hypothetical protein
VCAESITDNILHKPNWGIEGSHWETCGGVNGSRIARTPGLESTLQFPGLLGRPARRAHSGQGTPGARGTKSAASLPFTVPRKYGRNAKVTNSKVSWVSQIATRAFPFIM